MTVKSKKIRIEREKRNISQGNLAKKIGISQEWLCRIEKGKVNIDKVSVETLEKIAEALDSNVPELFYGKE